MRLAIHAQEQVYVANKPARRAAIGLVRLCRKHPDAPALVFSFEIGVVLVILKMLGLIRNRIFLRESTAIMSHCSSFWQWMYRRVGPYLNGIIAQSQNGLSDLTVLFRTRQPLAVIHNPCAFARSNSERMFERRNGSLLRLLMVGRLAPMKGHVKLLRAIRVDMGNYCSQTDTHVDWRLTIAGDGPCKNLVEVAIKELKLTEQVEMVGSVSDVRPVYETADIFVMASEYEGLPNALLEAIASGCRVIVVDGDGGASEFMRKIGLGAFVFSKEAFESSFWRCLHVVLESDILIWRKAHTAMLEKVSPGCVANQIWDFMQTVQPPV